MHKLTIDRPIPSPQLRQRVLRVDHSFYLVLQVRHRHVGGSLVTDLEVQEVEFEDYVANDGHGWRRCSVVEICGTPPTEADACGAA
jgi:hypothetical protein